MLLDFLYETLTSGGFVILPILVVGALGFYFVGLGYYELGTSQTSSSLHQSFEKILTHLKKGELTSVAQSLGKIRSPLKPYIHVMIDNKHLEKQSLENLLKEKISHGLGTVDRHLPVIGVFAAVAPLLGLLGTVSGMVQTFDVITVFGNSNPMLMADGISQALITTQSGLVVAFPLVLLHYQLKERITEIKKQFELMVHQFMNEQYGTNLPLLEDTQNGPV